MAKPFQLINRENKKDEKRIAVPREVNGRLWAELQPNIGGDYGFKEESFQLKIFYATGVVTASHKWLLGCLVNWEDCFEIQHRKANGKTEKGWTNWEANPEEEQLKSKWEEQGSLVAILCDGIPQLEILAEFASGRCIYNDAGYDVYPGKNPSKDLFSKIAESILEKKDSGYGSSRLNKDHKEFLKDNSWFYVLFTEDDVSAIEEDAFIDLFEPTISEECVNCTVSSWSEPEVKESGKRSYSGGAKGQTEKEIIIDRVDSVLKLFNVSSLEEMCEKHQVSEVALKLSLVLGTQWFDNGSSTIKENYIVKPEVASKEEIVLPPEESPVRTNGNSSNGSGSFHMSLILGIASERKFPKELDPEYLKAKGSLWCERFFTVLNGTIEGNEAYSKNSSQARKVSSFVNLKFKKALYELSTEELGTLIGMSEFKKVDEVIDSLPAV